MLNEATEHETRNPLLLNRSDHKACLEFEATPFQDLPVGDLLAHCEQFGRRLLDPNFSIFFAAVSLARNHRAAVSAQLLQSLPGDRLAQGLRQHLLFQRDSPRPIPPIWEEISGFGAWTHTTIARAQKRMLLDGLIEASKLRNLPPPGAKPTIIDVGTGDGALITDIINLLVRCQHFDRLHVVLIDQLAAALAEAEQTVRSGTSIPVELTIVEAPVESLDVSTLTGLASGGAWLTTAVASLHHLPSLEKIRVLTNLGRVTQTCFIGELEGNHDAPADGTPDLIYSAWRFYGCLLDNLYRSPVSVDQKQMCAGELLPPEASAILFNDFTSRYNYHMLSKEWVSVLQAAGGAVCFEEVTTLDVAECPRSLALLADFSAR